MSDKGFSAIHLLDTKQKPTWVDPHTVGYPPESKEPRRGLRAVMQTGMYVGLCTAVGSVTYSLVRHGSLTSVLLNPFAIFESYNPIIALVLFILAFFALFTLGVVLVAAVLNAWRHYYRTFRVSDWILSKATGKGDDSRATYAKVFVRRIPMPFLPQGIVADLMTIFLSGSPSYHHYEWFFFNVKADGTPIEGEDGDGELHSFEWSTRIELKGYILSFIGAPIRCAIGKVPVKSGYAPYTLVKLPKGGASAVTGDDQVIREPDAYEYWEVGQFRLSRKNAFSRFSVTPPGTHLDERGTDDMTADGRPTNVGYYMPFAAYQLAFYCCFTHIAEALARLNVRFSYFSILFRQVKWVSREEAKLKKRASFSE